MNMLRKFKAWDLERKEFIKALDFLNHLWNFNHQGVKDLDEIHLGGDAQDGYKVLFFTGLKDKNGREIYEGDVLTDEKEKYLCEFSVEFAVAKFAMKNPVKGWHFGGNADLLTVIGNIYENPDLI